MERDDCQAAMLSRSKQVRVVHCQTSDSLQFAAREKLPWVRQVGE